MTKELTLQLHGESFSLDFNIVNLIIAAAEPSGDDGAVEGAKPVEQDEEQKSTTAVSEYDDWQLDEATWDIIARQVP